MQENQRKNPRRLHRPKKLPLLKRRLLRRRRRLLKSAPRKRCPHFSFESIRGASHTLQDAEESGEDFAEDIDNVPAEEDDPPEADNKKRKVCPTFLDKVLKCVSYHASVISDLLRKPLPLVLNLRRRKQNRPLVVLRR